MARNRCSGGRLQRDSRVADVVLGPNSPEDPHEHRTSHDEQGAPQADRPGVGPPMSHEPTLGRRAAHRPPSVLAPSPTPPAVPHGTRPDAPNLAAMRDTHWWGLGQDEGVSQSERQARVVALLEDNVRTELKVVNGTLYLGLSETSIERLMSASLLESSTPSTWIGHRTG